jgi:hypothetical protein
MKKYIYMVLLVVLTIGIGKSIYDQMNKQGAKATRLECHENSTVFEKVNSPQLFKLFQQDFKAGKVSVSIESEKAKYMESKLFEYVDQDEVKQQFIKFANLSTDGLDNRSTLHILIYENDKEDPGKKTPKSKLYAGYLVLSAKVDNKLVYKFQIDFFDHQGKDIPKVLQCAIKSIQTMELKKEEQ